MEILRQLRRRAAAVRPRTWWLAGAGFVAFAAVVALVPLRAWLEALVTWLHGLGAVGVALYAVVYVAAIAVAVPGSVLTMAAGFAWGPFVGFAIVSPVSVVGATVAFLIGRTLLRDRVAGWVAESPRLRAVDDAVAQHGSTMVVLLRLSPVMPFNFLNYVMGSSRLSAARYALASWVGTTPGTFLYAYLGSTLPALGAPVPEDGDGGTARSVLLWGGLVATVIATWFVGRLAQRALGRRLPPADPGAPAPSASERRG